MNLNYNPCKIKFSSSSSSSLSLSYARANTQARGAANTRKLEKETGTVFKSRTYRYIYLSLYIYISWSQSLGHFPTAAHSFCSQTGLILHFTPLPAVDFTPFPPAQTSLPCLTYRLHSPSSRTENIPLAGASVHLLARAFYWFRQ